MLNLNERLGMVKEQADSVVDVESTTFTRRLVALLTLTFAAYVAVGIVKELHKMNDAKVIEDVELFLKSSRLQGLILGNHQEIIDAISNTWINEPYRGPVKKIQFAEWQKQTLTATLKT